MSSEEEVQILDSVKEYNHDESIQHVLSTPKHSRLNILLKSEKTPQIRIPPSPAMIRLGYGTGENYLKSMNEILNNIFPFQALACT
jgi:hypothetical protein